MSLCATEDTKGFYFGYFWVWYQSAQIIGNLTGAIMIKQTMGPPFFIILSCAEILFFMLFCFIRMPTKIREAEHDTLEDSEPTEEKEPKFLDNLKYTLKFCVSK